MKKGVNSYHIKTIFSWCLGGFIALILGLLAGFNLWAPHVVSEFQTVLANTSNNTLIYDRDDKLIATIEGLEDRHIVPISKIHPTLQKAVVAVEDRRFFNHRGLDPIRLIGAFWANLRSMSYYQGGSTITQQLVKLSLLSSERTISRKVKELFMAVALELKYSKLKLLEFYLNRVYLGYGLYGVEKASRNYFHKSAAELNLNEATFLAALIKKPQGYLEVKKGKADPSSPLLPFHLMKRLKKRQRFIIATMGNLGWVPEEEIRSAISKRLMVHRPVSENQQASYFVQHTIKELRKILKINQVAGRGYRVYTTLDSRAQRKAEAVTARFVKDSGGQSPQVALIAMEPSDGSVRALVGGVDFAKSQFNRATQALRQPGSAFKPILYAAALENGLTPNTIFTDEPVRYIWTKSGLRRIPADLLDEDEFGEIQLSLLDLEKASIEDIYEPRNYNDHYGSTEWRDGIPIQERSMTMARALEVSSNVIAVQVLDRLGFLPLLRLTRRLDLPLRPEMGLCIALGCSETTLMDLTAVYAIFANGGKRTKPVFIRSVLNLHGDKLFEHFPDPPEQVLTPWTAFQMNKMLSAVISRGTGRRAWLGRPAGGKTGTNDGPRDAWFIGFTPELVTGVWIGKDDNSLIVNEAGGRSPARLWKSFNRGVLKPYNGESFPKPDTEYTAVRTCTISGEIANPFCPRPHLYYYKDDEIPGRTCTTHPRVPPAPPRGPDITTETAAATDPSKQLFARKLEEAFQKQP